MSLAVLKIQIYALAQALRFLTTLPLPQLSGEEQADWRQHLKWAPFFYPLIGSIFGLFFIFIVAILGGLFQPILLSAIILGVWIVLSGALHLDGLADCADAWVGGLGSKEKTLAIMKDPACGPVGVSAILGVLLLKFSALVQLLSAGMPLVYLLLAPVLGRFSIVLLRLTTPYVRKDGLGEEIFKASPAKPLIAQGLLLFALLLYFFSGVAVGLLFATALTFFIVRKASMLRLSGCTGDLVGAMVELIEVSSLLALCLYF